MVAKSFVATEPDSLASGPAAQRASRRKTLFVINLNPKAANDRPAGGARAFSNIAIRMMRWHLVELSHWRAAPRFAEAEFLRGRLCTQGGVSQHHHFVLDRSAAPEMRHLAARYRLGFCPGAWRCPSRFRFTLTAPLFCKWKRVSLLTLASMPHCSTSFVPLGCGA